MSEKSHSERPDLSNLLIDSVDIRHGKKYKLIDGTEISIIELGGKDIEYLCLLAIKARQGVDYFELLHSVRGLGAYPLKRSFVITEDIAASVLFRTAEDIVARAGTHKSYLIPPQQAVDRSNNLLTVATVAHILDVTRAAVYLMLRSGRLKSTKYGRTALIKREDLEQFCASWPGPKRKRSE